MIEHLKFAIKKFEESKLIRITVLIFLLYFALQTRFSLFSQSGKDIDAYKRAVEDFLEGRNPYTWTIESYSNPNDPGNHGFAYLPGILYINMFLFLASAIYKIPLEFLWKLPIFLADAGVAALIIKQLYKKSFWAMLLGLFVWLFNPYIFYKNNYVANDPIPIFFMFLSLIYLEKDSVLSGTFYAFSIALKTFPIILFPILFFKSQNKLKFLTACLIIGLFVSFPFMRSVSDFNTYIKGALLIHTDRFVQGRPFLYYVSYYYKIEFFRIIPFGVYTFLATFSGWLVSTVLIVARKVKNTFTLSTVSFLCFYLFTPVLNRTYLMWFIPVLIFGLFNSFYSKYKFVYYFVLFTYYFFYYWYLSQWKDGFHIWHP